MWNYFYLRDIKIFKMKKTVLIIMTLAGIALSGCREAKNSRLLERWDAVHEQTFSESPEKAHEGYQHLADDFHKVGNWAFESCCLYEMANNYFNQRDTIGLQRIMARMKELAEDHPDDAGVGYSYHSMMSGFYAARYEEDGLDETRDAIFDEIRQALALQERMSWKEMEDYRINPVWNYYNMATGYDIYCEQPVRDSIEKYLAMAEKVNRERPNAKEHERQQGDVSIRDERAWLYYADGQIDRALEEMTTVLALIDSVETVAPNTVLTERGEAYAFFVEVYTAIGEPEKALEYQQLKGENDRVRFGAERNAAVREVEARYNVAKVETRLSRVQGIAAVFVLLLVAMVIYYRMLIRSREQSRYTAAVEALVEKDLKVRKLTAGVSHDLARKIFDSASKPLSAVERQYILLFMSGSSTEEIATAMNVDVSSVYTMRYRIKKKYPPGFSLPF